MTNKLNNFLSHTSFTTVVLALILTACGSKPSISVSGTVTIPGGLNVPDGTNIMVYLSVLDTKKSMQYRLDSIKVKYDGTTSYSFVFPGIPIEDLTNFKRIYISGGLDLNANTGIEKDEPKGGTSVEIGEPPGPIEGVEFEIKKY